MPEAGRGSANRIKPDVLDQLRRIEKPQQLVVRLDPHVGAAAGVGAAVMAHIDDWGAPGLVRVCGMYELGSDGR